MCSGCGRGKELIPFPVFLCLSQSFLKNVGRFGAKPWKDSCKTLEGLGQNLGRIHAKRWKVFAETLEGVQGLLGEEKKKATC